MQCLIKGRVLKIDLQPIILSSLMLAWSVYYYFSTVGAEEGPRSVLFIKPLVIGILICFPLVVRGSVKLLRDESESVPQEDPEKRDRGFLDNRRLFFAAALAAYALAITFLGYLIPSVLFMFSVLYYLGSRNPWLLIALPLGCAILLSFSFRYVLTVPVSIWPSW
jgi:hypothetical protein